MALYRASGLASLARKTRLDHGALRVVSEPMKRAIEGLALESHPVPITSVHRQIKEYAQAIGEIVPSYWTVYDIVREVPPSLRTLAHQGAKSYGESFDLIHRREASKPNSIWIDDQALANDRDRRLQPSDRRYYLDLTRLLPSEPRLLCGRGYGVKGIRTGRSAACPTSSTQTTAPTSPPSTFTR